MLEDYLSQGFSYDTQKTYRSVLSRFIQYLEENRIKIEEVKPEVVFEYIKKYRATTQKKLISVIRTYYRWVTKLELAIDSGNVLCFREDRDLNISDAKRLIRAARCKRDALMMRTLFITGLRVAEIARIKKEDIKIEERQFWLYCITKGNKERRIKLQSGLARELLEFNSGKDTLFSIGRRHIERIIAELSKDVLGRVVTPHCFRHGFATELMKQGVSFGAIREALGHEKIETTLRYLHNKRNADDKWFIDL